MATRSPAERPGSSGWLKDVAPSDDLRRWFGHEPEKWAEFRRRYFAELDAHPEAWGPLRDAAAAGDITLLYSSRDVEHNNAVALREYLTARLADVGRPLSSPPDPCSGPAPAGGSRRPD